MTTTDVYGTGTRVLVVEDDSLDRPSYPERTFPPGLFSGVFGLRWSRTNAPSPAAHSKRFQFRRTGISGG